jgi:hypothetical protein
VTEIGVPFLSRQVVRLSAGACACVLSGQVGTTASAVNTATTLCLTSERLRLRRQNSVEITKY